MMIRSPGRAPVSRRGAALVIALVALAFVTVVMASLTWQCLASRQLVERRQNQLQAEWLARSGLELAAARLLADPAGYQGEAVELIPGGQVRIEVRNEASAPDVFRVTSEGRFPGDGLESVLRSVTRSFRRTTRGD